MYRDPNAPVKKKKQKKKEREQQPVSDTPNPEEAAKARAEAISLAMAERMEEALVLFEKAVRLDPDNASHLSDLGVTYLRLQYLDKAKTTLDKARMLAPHDQVRIEQRNENLSR